MPRGTQREQTRLPARSAVPEQLAPAWPEETYSSHRAVEHLGARLRALRIARNMTIAQVAEAAGLTKGFMSRLERDQTSVSIAALLRICEVLHTSIGSLFEAPATCLVRASEVPLVELGKGLRRLTYTPADVDELQVVRLQLAPGASTGREAYALHDGMEFIQVLSGMLEFQLDSKRYRLTAGDSLTFRGNVLHTYRNTSRTKPCEAFLVLAPAPP